MGLHPLALSTAGILAALGSEPSRGFYHACQLRDLESYLLAGAILCRDDLRALGAQACTPYDTDASDFRHGYLAHIFGNLDDHGWGYRFLLGAPDVYGPILLEFELAALEEFSTLTVRRHGVRSGDAKCVETEAELRELFLPALPERLRPDCRGEIEGQGRRLSLLQLRRVVVLPLVAGGAFLSDAVSEALDVTLVPAGINPDVVTRDVLDEHLDRLVEWAAGSSEASWETQAPPGFIVTWMQQIADHRAARDASFERKTFERGLRRFARYLEHGTLSRMRGEPGFLR